MANHITLLLLAMQGYKSLVLTVVVNIDINEIYS